MFTAATAREINGVSCRYLLLPDFSFILVANAVVSCRQKALSDSPLLCF